MATDNNTATDNSTENEMITTKTVVELDEKTAPVDADLFMAGDAGTAALKKFKWSNLLAAIKTKLAAWTFDTLTTNNKTLPGAVNELNSKMSKSTAVSSFTNIGSSADGMIFALYALVIGTRNSSNIWTVHIHGKITTNTGTSDMFHYGIGLSLLKQALGATGALNLIGGNYTAHNSSGSLISNGYAGGLEKTTDGFLRFSRYYKLPNTSGAWPASSDVAAVGTIIHATVILKEA